ncbi:MAG: YceI family protein [Saprospiraceae bacterium]|nr:YceI family protein [Saprospiraceae bacterium]
MKKLQTLFAFLVLTTASFAQDWKVDKGHSKVAFIVQHHGISEVDGYFKKYEATLTTAKADLSDATFEMTVETPSITTDLEMRDKHLRGEDIFNVEKFPTMTFKSTSFKKKKKNQYIMVGDLTLRGVTKQVRLDVTMNGPVENPNKNAKNSQVGIKAVGKIKRSDFNLGSKLITAFVSDEIQIRVTGEFNKAKD